MRTLSMRAVSVRSGAVKAVQQSDKCYQSVQSAQEDVEDVDNV